VEIWIVIYQSLMRLEQRSKLELVYVPGRTVIVRRWNGWSISQAYNIHLQDLSLHWAHLQR